jgi:dCTP deaminase
MSIKPDHWIEKMALENKMITPFEKSQIAKSVISFGLSAYGYDFRLSNEFKIFDKLNNSAIDPKNINEDLFTIFKGNECLIPPNSFVLGKSLEYFRIPRNILGICVGKSTYARCGIITNVTPLEPEWEGYITISISNTTPVPAKIYANEGICQVIFFESDSLCKVSYADKKGKYQSQKDIEISKIR